MGIFRKREAVEAPKFAVDAASIPPEVFGLESYADPVARAARVSRSSAIQVPAVKRARDLIPGTLGTLPFVMRDEETHEVKVSELLKQPETDVPATVTYAKTFDDMFFEGVAWWHITEFDDDDFPLHVVRLEPGTVDVLQDGRVYDTRDGHRGTAVRYYEDRELIRFDSPNDPFLIAAARAIRTCLSLDDAAAMGADGVPPVDYFTPAENADIADDTDVQAVLDQWQVARRQRRTGYVPLSLKYNINGFNPEQLQLAEQRQHAVLEIARSAGCDPEELGVSTTSRTYANSQDRRKSFTDFTLGGYLRAFEDRLSMNDVSRPGEYARADLAAFLRTDDLTRMQTYTAALAVGAITRPEIREAEQKPPLDEADQPAPQESNVVPLAASVPKPSVRFDSGPALKMAAPQGAEFAVDFEKRTITGMVVPYGIPAESNGELWQFSPGTLVYTDATRVKLWINHDSDRAVGFAQSFDDRPDGMYAVFKVARGAAGDEALSMAEDKVWDGFSIGLAKGGKYVRRGRVSHAVEAPLMEVSLTPAPAFDDARVHAVAASATNQGVKMTAAQRARLAELRALATLTEEQKAEQTTLEALEAEHPEEETDKVEATGDVAQAVAAGVAKAMAQFAKGPLREVVKAGRPLQVVREEAPYRFGIEGRGKHDFSSDIIAGLRDHDTEALARVGKFMEDSFPAYARPRGPRFDIDSADVNELNPTRNRPEMYVAEVEYSTPLYDALFKGALEDITPFMFPKFNSSSGLVSDHVEGVEPTPGAFTATGQTVTPSALSGKVEITREVWDQGGNPQVSTLIWNEMQREWKEELEAYAATLLASSTPGSGGYPAAKTLTAGAADDDLVNELETFIASLQFRRGGNRFTRAFGHVDLYTALVDAVDADGRKMLPIIGAANANGTAAELFASLRVAGQKLDPSWALGATGEVAAESFMVNPADVHIWNSAPKRLTFEYRVAYVDLAIWGYKASAISRPAGVQSVIYDPVA